MMYFPSADSDLDEIAKNDYNLNITRYISTAVAEDEIDLEAIHRMIVDTDAAVSAAKAKHNAYLRELGLKELV